MTRRRARTLGVGGLILAGVLAGQATYISGSDPETPVCRLLGSYHSGVVGMSYRCGMTPNFSTSERIGLLYHDAMRSFYEAVADLKGEPPISLAKLGRYRM